MEPTKLNYEKLVSCGCTDEEIAGRFGLTLVELAALTGGFIQDDPDFKLRCQCLRASLTAKSKEKLAQSVDMELSSPELEPISSKYVLDRRSPEYNPKLDITSGLQPVTGFTITPPDRKE